MYKKTLRLQHGSFPLLLALTYRRALSVFCAKLAMCLFTGICLHFFPRNRVCGGQSPCCPCLLGQLQQLHRLGIETRHREPPPMKMGIQPVQPHWRRTARKHHFCLHGATGMVRTPKEEKWELWWHMGSKLSPQSSDPFPSC